MIRKSVVRGHLPREMALDRALGLIKKAGFDGVQLHIGADSGDVHLKMSAKEVKAVAKLARGCGLKVHSFMPSLGRLLDPDPAARAEAVDRFRLALERAAWMGVKVLLVHPGAVNEECPYDAAWEWCTDAFRRLLPAAEKARCCLAMENVWNKFLLSPLEARAFVDQFRSTWVRFYFDVGNIIPYGYAEQWIRILAGRIAEVHFKDFRRSVGTGSGFVPLLAGDVNWPAVMKELRAIRYSGFVCSEVGGYAKDAEAGYPSLRDISAAMDVILKM